MAIVEVKGIGLAERSIIQRALSWETTANRTTAYMIKRLRRQFDLRGAMLDIEAATEREIEKLRELGFEERALQGRSLTWQQLLEQGWHQPDQNGPEIYGEAYTVDPTDARWLLEKIESRGAWITDRNGDEVPIDSAMMEAVANVMMGIEEALET